MNLQINSLGDPLTTHPIQRGWEMFIQLYPNSPFGCLDSLDREVDNRSVPIHTRTYNHGLRSCLQSSLVATVSSAVS